MYVVPSDLLFQPSASTVHQARGTRQSSDSVISQACYAYARQSTPVGNLLFEGHLDLRMTNALALDPRYCPDLEPEPSSKLSLGGIVLREKSTCPLISAAGGQIKMQTHDKPTGHYWKTIISIMPVGTVYSCQKKSCVVDINFQADLSSHAHRS